MLRITHLQTEYKDSPLGMDEHTPRFSYRLEGTSHFQTERRITVTEENSGRTVWDSGWGTSSETIQITYQGKLLRPHTSYCWTVCVRDEKKKIFRASSRFETGFLGQWWTAKWIGNAPHSANKMPVLLCKGAVTAGKKIVSARLYITALGLYSAEINAKKVTEDCFTPGWTQYDERVQYQAYDVTKLIVPGKENILNVRLAEGWYAGRIARIWRNGNPTTFGNQPLLKAELHLRNADGTLQKLVTDENWACKDSEILSSDIYDGEHCCACKRDPAWNVTPPEKGNVHIFKPETRIEWQSGPALRRMRELKPVSIKKTSSGKWLVDFGQNIAGRERLILKGAHPGDVITVRHGEMLYKNGLLYTENLRTALALTIYEANDDPVQIYEPEFTYSGFRYLEISGWPGTLKSDSVLAVSMHSDLPETGSFSCSDPLVNQLYRNIIWTQRNNFFDVPTDCPQRDERYGWSGDAQVFANAATYNMYAPAFYRKWIRDLNLSATPYGVYWTVAPYPYREHDLYPVTGWGDAGIVCPWFMFVKYGEADQAKEYLNTMEKHLDRQTELAGGPIVRNACFGDWLNIDDPTDEALFSSAYLAGTNRLLAKLCRVLGDEERALKRERIADEISEACRNEFLTKKGEFKFPSQTAAVLFLHFRIVETPSQRRKVLDFLVKDIFETKKCHLSTGFLGTQHLLRVLSENGRTDLAYKLFEQRSCPGWLYPVTQGATTMWERWNSWTKKGGFGDVRMNSFDHYAFGSVAEWFYETVCGIQPSADEFSSRAFHHFRLAPVPGGSFKHASGSYESMYGKISSAWKIRSGKLIWDFTLPCNTTAEIVFPGSGLLSALPSGITKKDGKYIAQSGSYSVTLAR